MYALRAQIDTALAKQLCFDIQRLCNVMGGSADKLARGTNVIREAIGNFDASATQDVDKLSQALNAFRGSMDKSSNAMASLTRWLVFYTGLLALFTALLVFKDSVASWLQWLWAAMASS